jgi:hypothetical protein
MNVLLIHIIVGLILVNTLLVVYLWWSDWINLQRWYSMTKWMENQEKINALHRQMFVNLEKELSK